MSLREILVRAPPHSTISMTVATLEETERIARRVPAERTRFHGLMKCARAALRARDTAPSDYSARSKETKNTYTTT